MADLGACLALRVSVLNFILLVLASRTTLVNGILSSDFLILRFQMNSRNYMISHGSNGPLPNFSALPFLNGPQVSGRRSPVVSTPFEEEDTYRALWDMDLAAESEDRDISPRPSLYNVPDYSIFDVPEPPQPVDLRVFEIVASYLSDSRVSANLWLLYAVTKRLLERKATFLQLVSGSFLLFCEQGVFQFGNEARL